MDMLKGFCEFIRNDMVNAGLEDFKETVLIMPFALAAGLIWLLIRRAALKRLCGGRHEELLREYRLNETVRFLFTVYMTALAALTLLPSGIFEKLLIFSAYGQWTPMPPYRLARFNFLPKILLISDGLSPAELFNGNTVLNIALFVPFGAAAPLIRTNLNFYKTVLAGALISCSIELTQIFLMRDPDINDIICNTSGAAAGCMLYIVIRKLFPAFTEKCGRGVSLKVLR